MKFVLVYTITLFIAFLVYVSLFARYPIWPLALLIPPSVALIFVTLRI